MAVDIIARGLAGAAGEQAEIAQRLVAEEYDPTHQYYNTNDIVTYEGKLYICTSTNVTGTFDPTKWQQIVVSSELTEIVNKLATITNPMLIKGRVDEVSDLPVDAEPGWVYFVGAEGSTEFEEYVYTENDGWQYIGVTQPVDTELLPTSTNPVQNRVITAALDEKYPKAWDVALTMAEYEALPTSKYTDGKNYYITDAYPDWEPIPTVVYGYHVDPDESDPYDAVTYLNDAVGMTPAAMGSTAFNYGSWQNAFFMPKPCMVKFDGTVDYYLDPNDYTKKADGTASDVADPNYDGNAMMEWPLIWYKYEAGTADGEGYFYVSNKQADNTFHCWCNYDCDGNIINNFYTAIYNGTGTDKLRSISGVALTSANGNGGTTYSQESTRAMANNTTAKTEWFIDVWSDRMLINGLLILMGKSLNSQATFGRGLDTGGQTAKEAYVTGALNDKGLFWGNISAGTSGVKVFGMENWWGCVWHRTVGLIGLTNGDTAYKLTYGTVDGTTNDGYSTTGDGYHINTVARPSSNYVKSCKFGDFGYLPLSTTGGSASTYYTDYWYTNNSALTFALVGGSTVGANGGVSCFNLTYAAGSAYWDFAAALTLKPLA